MKPLENIRRLVVVPDDGTRAELFALERERLQVALGAVACVLDIQHVGSTAVPGLDAKSIIDIAIGVTSFEDAHACREPLVALGYVYRGENGIPLRHFFAKNNRTEPDVSRQRTHHIHVLEIEGDEWQKLLAFRDALCADDTLAQHYAALKHELAVRYADDIMAYCNGKTAFITAVLAKVQST